MSSGIYKWTNKVTQNIYIGQAKDLNKRCKEFLSFNKTYAGQKINEERKKYNSLIYWNYEILTKCDEKDLNEKEKYYIEQYENAELLNITHNKKNTIQELILNSLGNNDTIVQSYYITSAKYDFAVHEKRLLYIILKKLKELFYLNNETEKLITSINLKLTHKDYAIKLNDNQHHHYNSAFNTLLIKPIITNIEGNETEIYIIDNYTNKRGEITINITKKFIETFLQTNKGFSKFNYDIVRKLKSVYAMRLYELLCRQTQPLTYKISYLKEIFGATQKAYEINNNFIRRVIISAQKELNEKANWSFEYKLIKEGKKYNKITFIPKHIKLIGNDI